MIEQQKQQKEQVFKRVLSDDLEKEINGYVQLVGQMSKGKNSEEVQLLLEQKTTIRVEVGAEVRQNVSALPDGQLVEVRAKVIHPTLIAMIAVIPITQPIHLPSYDKMLKLTTQPQFNHIF